VTFKRLLLTSKSANKSAGTSMIEHRRWKRRCNKGHKKEGIFENPLVVFASPDNPMGFV